MFCCRSEETIQRLQTELAQVQQSVAQPTQPPQQQNAPEVKALQDQLAAVLERVATLQTDVQKEANAREGVLLSLGSFCSCQVFLLRPPLFARRVELMKRNTEMVDELKNVAVKEQQAREKWAQEKETAGLCLHFLFRSRRFRCSALFVVHGLSCRVH